MTAGSWTVGSSAYANSKLYAQKTWSGTDGKFEAWQGGTRVKWNNYAMVHWRWTSTIKTSDFGVGSISKQTPATLKSLTGWSANDDLRLLAKLAERIKGHSFDLGINIAEGKKTYEQILGNLTSIGKALVALKHGHPGQALRHLGVPRGSYSSPIRRRGVEVGRARNWRGELTTQDVTGRWLEMQYGWLPLVSQSYEAAKALAAATGPRRLKFYASVGNKSATYEGSQSPTVYTYPVSVTYGQRIHAELYEDVGLNRSLGLVDPLAIAWEVVPYSFVVDWFIPIGTYLSVWSMIPSLKGRFLTTTRIGQKAGGFALKPGVTNPFVIAGYGGTTKVERWFRIDRSISSSLAVPLPTFNSLPRALSPKRLLNAVSLIHQLL